MSKHNDDLQRLATDAYEAHHLVEASANSWLIARPKSCWYLTRIICTEGAVILTGDGPNLILRGGPSDAHARLRWLAKASPAYIASKAVAGPQAPLRLGYTWTVEDAIEDMRAQRANVDIDDEALLKAWTAALAAVDEDSSCHDIWSAIALHLGYDELEAHYGERVDPAVFYAQAAVRRLLALLPTPSMGAAPSEVVS